MGKRNLWIILTLVCIIALAWVLGMAHLGGLGRLREEAPSLEVTDAPLGVTASPQAEIGPDQTAQAGTPMASPTAAAMEEQEEPQAYLLVTVGKIVYQPVPLQGEGDYTLSQKETGMENVVHVTKDSIAMKSATCDNQDCVKQGVVTLENKDSRILGNMIICLPNQVTLELLTPEELTSILTVQ